MTSHYELQQLSNPHRHLTMRWYHDRTKSDLFFLSVRENTILLKKKTKKQKNLSPYFVFYDFDNILERKQIILSNVSLQ